MEYQRIHIVTEIKLRQNIEEGVDEVPNIR